MRVRHKDKQLALLEADASYNAKGAYSKTVVRGFRKAMQYIRSATDERDIRAYKSLRYEKLQPPRDGQHSVRVNDQFRLILEWEGAAESKTAVIVGIEDYH